MNISLMNILVLKETNYIIVKKYRHQFLQVRHNAVQLI